MSSLTVRISRPAHKTLREIAERAEQPMQAVLDEAIEQYRRQKFLEEVNAAYAKLRTDRRAMAAMGKERAMWEATLEDGLPRRAERKRGGPAKRSRGRSRRG